MDKRGSQPTMVDHQKQKLPQGSTGLNYFGEPPQESQSIFVVESAIDNILQIVAEKKYQDYIN